MDCSSLRSPFSFSVEVAWTSPSTYPVDNRSTPIAGDIDGDGIAELICVGKTGGREIFVFDGPTGAWAGTATMVNPTASNLSPLVIHRPSGANAKALIFAANVSSSKTMALFEVSSAPGVRPIEFTKKWEFANVAFITPNTASHLISMPIVADFDGDGVAEFFVSGCFIDVATGNILATVPVTGVGGWFVSFPLAADVNRDGKPELIVGTKVYNFNRAAGIKISTLATCPGLPEQEGFNMVADINQDGLMDVVYHNAHNHSDSAYIKVWTPETGLPLGDFIIEQNSWRSYPFVGDIDGTVDIITGKKYPEICINVINQLYAYRYTGSGFTKKWMMPHEDGSGATSLTLYDFDLNGVVELVYRDEKALRIFDGSGSSVGAPIASFPAQSTTLDETPIVADVTGEGSANILYTSGATSTATIVCLRGAASKWAACPNVWNQQLYSPLTINTDLTVPASVQSGNLAFTQTCNEYAGNTVQYYNGGPMQAPYINGTSHCPVDLSPDVYVIGGTITFLSQTSVRLDVTFGNMGLVIASANMPIRYYKNDMTSSNIIGTSTLGANLLPGQTRMVSKILTGLDPMPTQFYVRVLDDGINFPALGAYSDCNLTNNHKSFGTLELLKTVNSINACIDGTSIFNIRLINNTNQTDNQQTFNNLVLTDSLGYGWEYLSSNASNGSLGTYNLLTHRIQWNLPSLLPGDTALLTITAKATNAGSIRNYAWIESVDGTILGREVIEAYVAVSSDLAPAPATISPGSSTICPPGGVTLTASVTGKSSYQWYRNNVEISNATQQTYTATEAGSYTVTYFENPCVSQMSDSATVSVWCYSVYPDNATVQEFQSVEIDILNNDVLPNSVFTPDFNLLDSITLAPLAGTLFCIGAGDSSKIVYTSHGTGSLVNNIDSFQYQITFFNPSTSSYQTTRATVYIYILQSHSGGFSTCYEENYTIRLTEWPAGVIFRWFDMTETFIGVGSTRNLINSTGDTTFLVQPVITNPSAYNLSGSFPPGLLTVKVINPYNSIVRMRWTGLFDTNWNNPNNWVEVHINGEYTYESPVSWTPAKCVDVVVSSDTPFYPELVDSATCRKITMQDRAMLKNPHVLDYVTAQVELKLKPSERDRFVMWSAPLTSMYSGDYHFKNGTTPQWGDVYMNIFQQNSPAGGVAQANTFTATFGQLGESLELGKAFNLRVITTSETKDKLWIFPQPDNTYTDRTNESYSLIRTNRDRFITHGVMLNPFDKTFSLSISGNNNGGKFVQVVNPYFAYLDVTTFLIRNNTLAPNAYIIWDGDVNGGFTAVKFFGDADYQTGMRYLYSGQIAPISPNNPNLIPPLQSFFVAKAGDATSPVTSVLMSPNWTTTNGGSSFVLRAAEVEIGVLQIKATQENKTSYTVLQYDPNASPTYNDNEDVPNLFYAEIPLTLYSLTPGQYPLAINANGDFQSQHTDLGLRITNAGEIKLEFSGLSTFGHDVYLIDKEKNQEEINLQQTPEYTFMANKPANVNVIEINDRFSLRMDYTGNLSNRVANKPALQLSGNDGYIQVRSVAGIIKHLQIYNMAGMLIYSDDTASEEFRIPAERSQTYIVKAFVGNADIVEKVIVK
ncbi:MAG: DUF11 domain-containing protein [Tannerella sp.]|nr:DUF11 domain-containing protein [Tannerella sp.]